LKLPLLSVLPVSMTKDCHGKIWEATEIFGMRWAYKATPSLQTCPIKKISDKLTNI